MQVTTRKLLNPSETLKFPIAFATSPSIFTKGGASSYSVPLAGLGLLVLLLVGGGKSRYSVPFANSVCIETLTSYKHCNESNRKNLPVTWGLGPDEVVKSIPNPALEFLTVAVKGIKMPVPSFPRPDPA